MDDMYLFWRRKSSISGNTKEVFSALWELAGFKPGILTEVTLTRLSNFTGFSASALESRIKKLISSGLIDRETIGRGVFRIYVYHPSPEKREETRPQKIEKPTPLFDSLSDDDFILAPSREIHDETHEQIHDEIHEYFHNENHEKPITKQNKGLRVKIPSGRSEPSGGKYTLNNIKVKKEVFSSKTERGQPVQLRSNKRSMDELLHHPVRNHEAFRKNREKIGMILKVKDISPDLLDRIALGATLALPGFSPSEIKSIREEADQRLKEGIIRFCYIHIAKYAQDVFEANGYEWTPVRSARRARLENQLARSR